MCIKKLLFSLLLLSFCQLSSAETLKEYADKCTAEIGVAVPAFNCQTFELSQGEGSSFGTGPCHFPNRLNRKCDPGSRIKILHNDPNVSIVASCRKDGEDTDINDPFYNDIAVIQQNKKNGATCFYQALGHNDGSVAPSPSSTPVPGAAFQWLSPLGTANINCVGCHDNGAFIRSPYMANAGNFPAQNIGGSTITLNSDGDPYWFVGSDFQNKQWKTYSVSVKNNACLGCHRLSVSTTNGVLNSGNTQLTGSGTNSIEIVNGITFERSSAMDFSLIATAGKEFSKSPHGASSPIWMPAGSTFFDASMATAAKEISDCAHQFNINNLPNSDSCRITPHPKSVLNIRFPLTTDTENAGDRTNPGKIWVHIDPPVGALADVNQYTVKVAGVTATIVSGSQVGNEFWMVVEPVANNAAMPNAGLYDLDVTVKVPGFPDQSDKETKAVYVGDPGVPLDFAIVGDVSGSMSSNGKLEAAKNAARLYVDHASTGDKITVVKFANNATVDLAITDVTSTSLATARSVIDSWVANGQTAMGSGILRAAEQFNLGGNPQHQKRMALLTDGNENVWPLWADGPNGNVQFMVNAQDSIIDVVTLGDDADVVLAQDIANTTHGHYFRIDPSANVSLASTQSNQPLFIAQLNKGLKEFNILSESSAALKPGFVATSQTANTITLPNILANVYKSMAENARKESRIGDWNGQLSTVGEGDTYEITLESGLPEVLFVVNWNLPSQKMNILFNKLGCGRYGGQQIVDSTHMQCRIIKPTPGKWVLTVQKTSGTQATNYKVMVSAYSRMELMPYLPKHEFVSGETLPLFAYVGTNKPAKEATVFVNVLAPNGSQSSKQLFDDGLHDDGKAYDGYFGSAMKLSVAGTYSLDYTATGYTVEGVPFIRKARRSVLATPTRKLPYALMAKETLVIGDKSKVYSNRVKSQVYSGRIFELGNSAAAVASAFNNGIVYLRSASTLKGHLTYSGELVQEAGAVVSGDIKQQKITPPGFDNFFIHYGERDIYLDPGKKATWEPGNHRDVYVGSQSVLTLKGGTYRFRSLKVDSAATIKTIGGKEGPTLIYVEESISIADKTRIEGECVSCLVFYTNAKGPIRIEANTQFKGSVVAPYGEVDVASKGSTYINVAAQNIKVEASASISLTD